MHTGATQDDNRLLWVGVGLVLALLVGVALVSYLGPLLAAIFLYYATRPIYRRIDDRIDHPNVAVTLTLAVVVVPMALLGGYALFLIVQELNRVVSGGVIEAIRPYAQPYLGFVRQGEFQRLRESITESGAIPGATARGLLQRSLGSISTALGTVLGGIGRLFVLTVILFYLLRDDYKLRTLFDRSLGSDDRVVEFAETVDDDLETIFFNNLVLVVLTALQATVIYLAMNLLAPGGPIVATPALLGTLIGLGMLVPVVGMKIAYLPYAAYLGVAAVTTGTPVWHPVVFLVVSVVVVDTIPDVFIRTYLSARGSLHMGLILLGYVLGTMTFGWYGLFLGPIVVVLTYHFAHSVFPWLATSFLES